MELFDLRFCQPFRFAAMGKNIGHAFDGLTLPGADLVRMHLVFRGDLRSAGNRSTGSISDPLHRLVATQRLQRNLDLKLACKLPALRHSHIPSKSWDTP